MHQYWPRLMCTHLQWCAFGASEAPYFTRRPGWSGAKATGWWCWNKQAPAPFRCSSPFSFFKRCSLWKFLFDFCSPPPSLTEYSKWLTGPLYGKIILVVIVQRSFQKSCYRKIVHISYKDHVTNEEVRAKIQQAIGPHEDLLTIVKRRKLRWYGHVSRSSGLAKTILQGTVKGGRRQGR